MVLKGKDKERERQRQKDRKKEVTENMVRQN